MDFVTVVPANGTGRMDSVKLGSIQDVLHTQFGEQVKSLQSDEPVCVTEIDEMHTYIGTKKTINGYGLLLIDMKKDSSTSLLATEALPQVSNFGIISKNTLVGK